MPNKRPATWLVDDVADFLARGPSREELLARLWGIGGVETRTIDMHVARLRTKLKGPANGSVPEAIVTVRAQGYMAGPEWELLPQVTGRRS